MHDYDGLDEVVAQDNADYSEGKSTSQMCYSCHLMLFNHFFSCS